MTLPDKDSPFWPLARMALRGLVVFGCLAFVYNALDPRDIITMIVFVLGDGAISKLVQPGKE